MPERKTRVMAIGAHSDECHYGCGGTLYLLSQLGCECRIVHVSCHNHSMDREHLAEFDGNMDKAAEILGCRHIVIGDRGNLLYEGNRQDRALIMKELEDFQPELLFIMWPQDSHPEHRQTALCSYESYLNSYWNGRLPSVREIYAYEAGPCQSMGYFHPEFCINITPVWGVVENSLKTALPGKRTWLEKKIAARFRAWSHGFTSAEPEYADCFKIVKFPGGVGADETDLLIRRLLADRFHWSGGAPWPYGNEAYFR